MPNEDKLIVLLERVEQSEKARILPKEHTPEFRLLTELVNRQLELESKLEDMMEANNLFSGR